MLVMSCDAMCLIVLMFYFAAPVEKAVVRYSYSADNEDELNLKENDIIVILDKDLEDAGWWKGEINGKIGVFPDNFVELIPLEEVKKNFQNIETLARILQSFLFFACAKYADGSLN